MIDEPLQPAARVLLLALLCLLLAACGGKRIESPLPAEPDLEPDRLLIFTHGYLSSIDPMMGLVETFSREGVPRDWIEPGRPGLARYHAHSFDYVRFTRAGSDHNTPIESLAEAFATFYRGLPLACPVCARRADRPVRVSIIAHSFGGLVAREFLLREVESPQPLVHQVPGLAVPPTRWTIDRVISMGTPYFGSVRTRLSRGFLSLVVNGLVRTLVLGFVRPESGGVFGNVIDAQARAVRIGSLYLWTVSLRHAAWIEHLRARGEKPPPWLVVVGVDHPTPEFQGDGLTRFPSANVAPLFPGAPMETLLVGAKHTRLIRLSQEPDRLQREQRFMVRAMTRFIEQGTLEGDPTGEISPRVIVDRGPRSWLSPAGPIAASGVNTGMAGMEGIVTGLVDTVTGLEDAVSGPEGGTATGVTGPEGDAAAGVTGQARSGTGMDRVLEPAVGQRVYLRQAAPDDAVARADMGYTRRKLERVLASDTGDVWLRFYEGRPRGTGLDVPRILPLQALLSFFQNRVEPSRSWLDQTPKLEPDTTGAQIPTVLQVVAARSHIITIPDLTPTGSYRLRVRLGRSIHLTSEHVRIEIEGEAPVVSEGASTPAGKAERGIPLRIRPHRTNLIHVYLDGRAIRATWPKLETIDIREVALLPEGG